MCGWIGTTTLLLPGKSNGLYDCNNSDDGCGSNGILGRVYQNTFTNQFATALICDSVDN